jgi:hypothetical protein
MGAVVQPILLARIGPQPAAEAISGLEQQDVVLLQPPRSGEPGDTAADHHHVPDLRLHAG